MSQWIWQKPKWPEFTWDEATLASSLGQARLAQGQLLGMLKIFNTETQIEISSEALSEETITTSAIEGEVLNRDSVRSSIATKLGLANASLTSKRDRYIDDLVEVLLDASYHYKKPLTLSRLKNWQAALFPTGYSGLHKINVGKLRGDAPMQIVSGSLGKTKIHFEAPPRKGLTKQIDQFLKWFNGKESKKIDGLIRVGIAHIWFETLHPFDDGNGRIGRTIVDMALAQDEQLSTRYYSLSSQIMEERKGYYDILEKTTKGNLDITPWLSWFLSCLQNAIINANKKIEVVLQKGKFWQTHANTALNERQKKVLNKLLDAEIKGFQGGMTTRKYMNVTEVSRATAYRELSDLVEKKCLRPIEGKGRSSAYELDFCDDIPV